MKNPTVSVIIPTYNRANLIGRAIQSVLNQTYKDFELIIVDDGSTDNTKEVIKEFQKKDKKINYIRHEKNKGGSAARNTGIKLARGAYIAFLDSDDEWLPEKLERQIKAFEESGSQVGVIYTEFAVVSTNGKSMRERNKNLRYQGLRGSILEELLISNCVGTTSTVMVKRECFKEVGGFDEALWSCQDWDLWLRLAKVYQFKYIPSFLVNVYVHGNQITTDVDAGAKGLERLLDKHYRLFARDKKLLSNRQRYLGSRYCQSGNLSRGRYWFLKSLRTNPRNLRSYFYFGVSLLGVRLYTRLAVLKRRDDPFAKVNNTAMLSEAKR